MSELSDLARRAVEDVRAELDKVVARVGELEQKVSEQVGTLERDVEELVGLKTRLTQEKPPADTSPQPEADEHPEA